MFLEEFSQVKNSFLNQKKFKDQIEKKNITGIFEF